MYEDMEFLRLSWLCRNKEKDVVEWRKLVYQKRELTERSTSLLDRQVTLLTFLF